jgi:hypothetical protein
MEHVPTTDKRHHVTQVPPGSKKDQPTKRSWASPSLFYFFAALLTKPTDEAKAKAISCFWL